jgi:hypothetical protein
MQWPKEKNTKEQTTNGSSSVNGRFRVETTELRQGTEN